MCNVQPPVGSPHQGTVSFINKACVFVFCLSPHSPGIVCAEVVEAD